MAEIYSFPNNQDEYTGAEHVMRWHHGRTSGVFGAANNAAVAAGGGMNVTVSDGLGWLANRDGNGIVWWNDTESTTGAKLTLAVDTADGALNRIDRVVVSWPTTNYVARPTISILKGTASSAASAPALTNSGTLRQISLAKITIPAGTTAITAAMITDERMDGSVCGIVTDRVSVDTSMVNAQMTALLEKIEKNLSEIISGQIAAGSVSREKLATDALYSPVVWASNGEIISADHIGKTILMSSGSDLNVVFNENSLNSLPVGAEIAFHRWMASKCTLTFTGAMDVVANYELHSAATPVSITTETYNMFAVKKMTDTGIVITGNVEVV